MIILCSFFLILAQVWECEDLLTGEGVCDTRSMAKAAFAFQPALELRKTHISKEHNDFFGPRQIVAITLEVPKLKPLRHLFLSCSPLKAVTLLPSTTGHWDDF